MLKLRGNHTNLEEKVKNTKKKIKIHRRDVRLGLTEWGRNNEVYVGERIRNYIDNRKEK